MRKITNVARLILALVMLGAAVTGCAAKASMSDNDWEYIKSKGEMVIGITIYEPMNYYDASGALTGFDTEFAQAVCSELGINAKFVEINWETKEAELAAGTIDCIWNGLTITDERKENMLFSDSYIKNMQVVVIRKADAAKYASVADLVGATLAAEISSAGESAIKADETLGQREYVAAAKQTDALLEIKAGTADAAVLDYVMAMASVGDNTDCSELMIMENVELAAEEYAIGFRLESSTAAKVNEAIKTLCDNGKLDEIAKKYDLFAQLVKNQ